MVSAMSVILKLRTWLRSIAMPLRRLAVPAYRPELHYMRGPGPACAQKPPRDRDGR